MNGMNHKSVTILFLLLTVIACKSDVSGPGEPQERGDDYPYPEGRIYLTHLPVDTHRVVEFFGLGNMNVLPEDHGGFFTPREGWYEESTIPVYAPADGKITELIQDWYEWFEPYGHDLSMTIKVSTTMSISFGHMSDFAPEIWEAAGELQTGYSVSNKVNIEVKAGQIVGYIGTQGSMDWYIGDSELDLNFVNPERYPLPWILSGCYHDYYQEPLRTELLEITARTAEPRCGKIDYDVDGRIVGNWFWENEVPDYAFTDYSTHLSIAYDEILGSDRIAISDGSASRPDSPHDGDERFGPGSSRVFWVKGNSPRPEDIGISNGIIKYEILDRSYGSYSPGISFPELEELPVAGVLLIEMLDESRIRIERFMNKTTDEVDNFGPNARTYVR